MIVAVLGTGIMGAPMAANLIGAGFDVRVWNRTESKTAPLVELGAAKAATPGDAARGAEIVISMLTDGPTVRAVMTGRDGALAAMSADALWVQMSTVGVSHTERLAALATEAGVSFVDAPVLGTKQPAQQGALVVLAAGDDTALDRCQLVFDAVGSRTIRAGDLGAASKLKLVANNWVLAVTNGTAESIALAKRLGVDPQQFLESISGGALDLPYAHLKGGAMISGDYPLSFPLSLAAKDARLVLDAAGDPELAGTRGALTNLERAERAGHGGEDMAALFYGIEVR
ncbi:MAG: NAD(P)-dependent oxidoreductase [Sciscionella sp.]